MSEAYFVTPDLEECERLLDQALRKGLTGRRAGRYELAHPAGGRCLVLLYEKYYLRADGRLILTVVLDDFTGKSRVCCTAGGGGASADCGAAAAFEENARRALQGPGA